MSNTEPNDFDFERESRDFIRDALKDDPAALQAFEHTRDLIDSGELDDTLKETGEIRFKLGEDL